MEEPLLSHEEVMDRARRFQELVARERELQEFLLKLKFRGRVDQILEQKRQHDDALSEIERIRMEEILPIVVELNDFVKAMETRNGQKKK